MDLSDDYANIPYIPGGEAYPGRWAADAASFREAPGMAQRAHLGMPYAQSDRCAFDLFLPGDTPEGLCIFVHVGYWMKFDRSYWSHFAAGSLAWGWAVAMPSYDLCPAVTIAQITQQIATAVTRAAARVTGPIALVGHSAGGHLVARMGAEGLLPPEVTARIVQIMPISPVSDLRPLRQTTMNDAFRLSEADAIAESPALHPTPDIPVSVWVGAEERPVFLDQAQWIAAAWEAHHVVVPDRHHFDVIDALRDPESDMMHRLLGSV